MEDGISGGLQHHHETCCEKGGHRERQACMVQRWFHCGNVVSRQVDLYMTIRIFQGRLPHELFFIAIDNQGQVIIGPNKKMVAIHVEEKLEVLV